MNCIQCLPDSLQVRIRLHPPGSSVLFSRYVLNCILLDWALLCCPIFLLFYQTSYYIYHYIHLSAFSNFTSSSSTWNLQPGRQGITIHSRIMKPTLREHWQVHWRKQPIFIANQMVELPTQPSSMGSEIGIVRAIIPMLQDNDNSDWEISENETKDPGESTLSSDMKEDNLDKQQEVLHPNQTRHDQTIRNTRVPTQK